ncbi:MAG TPA: thiamine phosphate synthase [Casimicrobiaceae bacterium]
MSAAVTDSALRRRSRAQRLRGLYAVTPALDDTTLLLAKVAAALEGGATAVQYRCKDATESLRQMQALALARLHAARGALLIVNDDPALAANVGADGVHLGEDDASIMSARELLGPDRIIGVSCYNDFDRARAAVDAGADYVAFGSFFPSSTKPSARRADLELLRRARSLDVPVVAIGGIDADNARTLIDAGADAVAVITAVFLHDDPADVRAAAKSIVARMGVHQ